MQNFTEGAQFQTYLSVRSPRGCKYFNLWASRTRPSLDFVFGILASSPVIDKWELPNSA